MRVTVKMFRSSWSASFFQNLLRELLHYCDGAIKAEVVARAAEYEHRLTCGSKAIFHLEAFVASFMDIYHRQLTENASDLWM